MGSVFHWVAAVFLVIFTAASHAEGSGEPHSRGDQTLAPYFFIESGTSALDSFPLKSTDVAVRISGVIAEVTVTQHYANKGSRPLNACYVFPASTRAAFLSNIRSESSRIEQIVERMLALSALENQSMLEKKESLDFRAVVNTVL